MSQDIPSVSTTVALACVELFFNQVTTGGGDPVALHAKETKVIFSLNDTNTFFGWIEMVGTAGKITEEGKSTLWTYFTYKRRVESGHGFLDSALDGACALGWAPPSASLSYLEVLMSEQVWFLWTITNAQSPLLVLRSIFWVTEIKQKRKKQKKSCLQKAVQ